MIIYIYNHIYIYIIIYIYMDIYIHIYGYGEMWSIFTMIGSVHIHCDLRRNLRIV